MNNIDLSKDYLKEARIRLKYAEQSLNEDKDYAYCVRASQEAVELSIKAVLRLMGIEYAKTYDPGRLLLNYRTMFPDWFNNEINNIADISRWLRAEREPSMYGDEIEGIAPSKLYTESYCKKALESAKYVYQLCSRVINEVK